MDAVHGLVVLGLVQDPHDDVVALPGPLLHLGVEYSHSALGCAVKSKWNQCVRNPFICFRFIKVVFTVPIAKRKLLNVARSLVGRGR